MVVTLCAFVVFVFDVVTTLASEVLGSVDM